MAVNIKDTPGSGVLLSGNMEAGFFGRLFYSSLISQYDLASLVGLSAGVSNKETLWYWMKFSWKGKVQYYPSVSIRYNISWDNIKDSDLVFGNKIIEINGLRYRVRLMKGSPLNGQGLNREYNSEWNRLITSIHERFLETPPWKNSSYVEDNLIPLNHNLGSGVDGMFTDSDLGFGQMSGGMVYGPLTWMQENGYSDSGKRMVRGGSYADYSGDISMVKASDDLGWRPVLELVDDVTFNVAPVLTLNTANNRTLYENDTFSIVGAVKDTDAGDAVTVKYQIDSGTVRNLASGITDGTTPIPFSKELKYTDGILKDGNTVLTSVLAEGTPHTISVWSEDGAGGKSNIITRTFYVVPNRPPTLTIDPIAAQSNLINSNVIPISGRADDKDKNDVTVTFQINDSEAQHVFTGPPAAFTFNVMLKDLKTGTNTVVVKVSDIYNAETSNVLTINKTHNAVPVNKAIALYQINPPTGSAQKVLLWIERQLGDLAITAEISMTNEGEAENFVPLPRTNTGPKEGLIEDEFAYDAGEAKTNIVLKIIYNRTNSNAVETIKKISGVLS